MFFLIRQKNATSITSLTLHEGISSFTKSALCLSLTITHLAHLIPFIACLLIFDYQMGQ